MLPTWTARAPPPRPGARADGGRGGPACATRALRSLPLRLG